MELLGAPSSPYKGHRVVGDRPSGGTAHGDAQRVGEHYLEPQLVAIHAVERAAVGVRDLLGRNQDRLEQASDILLPGQRDADLI